MAGYKGKVAQITGAVLDVEFPEGEIPEIYDALEIAVSGKTLIAETAQQIGDNTVRCIALDSTDGLVRGAEAVNSGGPISVPVGDGTLGRMFNALGRVIDGGEEVNGSERWPIHRHPPDYSEQSDAVE
ncbi:MAG: F0F1 ATP synthase subunit beta, partial [Synergistaceae bacterium]|nr:F0F1 ATP synthase subunit beta [Synergistaceae bacterium]